jgi:hypothetical protein
LRATAIVATLVPRRARMRPAKARSGPGAHGGAETAHQRHGQTAYRLVEHSEDLTSVTAAAAAVVAERTRPNDGSPVA